MMTYTIEITDEQIQGLYRLLADKLAQGDVAAVAFLAWLDQQLAKEK